MKNTIKEFFRVKTTIIGIAVALLFQLVFSVVWMTGYEGVSDRIGKLNVGIVNEDSQSGGAIAEQLTASLPVQAQALENMEAAREQLEERQVQMIVHIPADFTARLAGQEGSASIQYILNESNPSMIKSMMSTVAAQITAAANKQAIAAGTGAVLAKSMTHEAAAPMAANLSERVVSDIQSVNVVKGTNNQMVPMMMVLASFVGAMIMGQNLEASAAVISPRTGRWQRLAARFAITIPVAVIVSLVGTSLVLLLGGQSEQGFIVLWGFQALFVLTFMLVTQTFLVLLGMPGMLINILLLSVQLVSSGAMMPREMLSDFYIHIGSVLPATYAVEGLMNVLFGGPGVSGNSLALLGIAGVMVLILITVSGIRREPAADVSQTPADPHPVTDL